MVPLAVRSVCALRKKSGVHMQPWLCKWETNRVARTEPPARSHSQIAKYRCFATTCAPAQEHSTAVRYSCEFEGAFLWLLSSNIN